MRLSTTRPRAGMHPSGRVRMYSPNPYQSGSCVSHYDVSLTPNALMEPAINADLTSSVDLTVPLFRDIGWIPRLLSAPGAGPSSRVALASSPNPSHGAMTVQFDLASDESVELALYDVTGRQVRMLAKGRFSAGPNRVDYEMNFPDDDPLLGATDFVLNNPGNPDILTVSDLSALTEQTVYHVFEGLGLPHNHRRYIHFFVNGSQGSTAYERPGN